MSQTRPGSGALIAPPVHPAPPAGSAEQALFLEARRRRRRRWLTGAVAVVVAAALAISAVTWVPRLSAQGTGQADGPGSALTGRSSAMSGHALYSWRVSTAGIPVAHGTDDITYSGNNRSITYSRTDLADVVARIQPRSTGAERVVGGRTYDQFRVGGQLRWVHFAYPVRPPIPIPNPRTLLRVLRPYTPFQTVGYPVIGGVRLKLLRATDPGGLTHRGLLPVLWTSHQPVGSLEMWVDGSGVVHRMTYTFRFPGEVAATQPSSQAALRAYQQAQNAYTHLVSRSPHAPRISQRRRILALHRMSRARLRAYPVTHGIQVTTTTLVFSSTGQPEHIALPPNVLSTRAYAKLTEHR